MHTAHVVRAVGHLATALADGVTKDSVTAARTFARKLDARDLVGVPQDHVVVLTAFPVSFVSARMAA